MPTLPKLFTPVNRNILIFYTPKACLSETHDTFNVYEFSHIILQLPDSVLELLAKDENKEVRELALEVVTDLQQLQS